MGKIKLFPTPEYSSKQSLDAVVPLAPCTGIFLGPSKSGKTVALISLILEQYRGVFDCCRRRLDSRQEVYRGGPGTSLFHQATSVFCPKNPSPGQRQRSVSGLVLARTLTESPCHQSCAQPTSILYWGQDCFTQSCREHRIAPTQSSREHRIAPLNPGVSTGLLHSILLPTQDCSTQSCCQRRIAPVSPRKLRERPAL